MKTFDPWPVFFHREWKRNCPFLTGFTITGFIITKMTANFTEEDLKNSSSSRNTRSADQPAQRELSPRTKNQAKNLWTKPPRLDACPIESKFWGTYAQHDLLSWAEAEFLHWWIPKDCPLTPSSKATICEHICSLPSAVNTFWFIYLLARETYMTRICFDSYAIVSDMSAAGLGLNKFCYAGLITAFKNKTPTTEETMAKILDFVGQSKGWQYVERVSKDIAENIMMNVSEEELYNLPTAEYVNRRGGFVFKQHTVYHVALQACAELRSKETLEALLEMFNKDNRDGSTYDAYMVMQAMR
ncbi:hypothetical protein Zm00014a_035726 [Zea mays]|uniref:Uncharacterized protein n=1 Tax=Zea mays TaxID=4577 RepID=A0A3L6E0D7_MAIZE|nr:hypothetical protein Zm00014a_035726 [Zea mays]